MIISVPVVSAQEPPHPPQAGHGIKGSQSPAGAAKITDGAGILIAFALAYGYKRLKKRKTKEQLISKEEQ